jgi:GntR family transcriptional regulator
MMTIWLDVNPRSGVPLYVQIVDQIKHAIDVGALRTGDQLPTVRQLAIELTIAPNTIVKAYNELQAMQLIESRAGVGTVVTAGRDGALREQQIDAVHKRLSDVVRDARGLGITADELGARFESEVRRYYDKERG